jgi:hypothetical protein
MLQVDGLVTILSKSFNWNAARIDFLAKYIIALLTTRSVNMVKIAEAFLGKASVDSHYKRLQRFFSSYNLNLIDITKFVLNMFPMPEGYILALDRTNWKLGSKNINALVLSMVYREVAIPLCWVFLDKQGNSNTSERIKLMKYFF